MRYRPSIQVVLSVACLLGGVACWTLLSSSFVFGEDHANRPIPGFLLTYGVAWTGYLLGLLAMLRGRIGLGAVILVGLAARLLLWPSSLIQENDVYRYVVDGQVVLHGENPYEFSPLDLPAGASGRLKKAVNSAEGREVLSRVGYAHVPSLYPPVAQWTFAAGAWIGGWEWKGQRFIFLMVDAAVLVLLILALRRRGQAPERVLLYWWNPLLLKEVANSAHADILVAFFLISALLLIQRAPSRPFLSNILAAGALAGAVLAKLHPLLLMPGLVLASWKRGRSSAPLVFAAVVTAVVSLAYLPFLEIGWERLGEGLFVYSTRWRMNEGFFSLVEWAMPQPRLVTALLIGAGALVLAWRFNGVRTEPDPVTSSFWTLMIWFLLIPTPFPWYSIPLVALCPILTMRESWPVVVLSGVFGLYYLGFYFEYRGFSELWLLGVRIVEHAVVWATILFSLLYCECTSLRRLAPSNGRM